jgi:hypothetical protein
MILVSLITFFHAQRQARAYWKAYHQLHLASLHFLGHPRASEEKLWDALIEAERCLARAEEGDQLQGIVPLLSEGIPPPGGRRWVRQDSAEGNGNHAVHPRQP